MDRNKRKCDICGKSFVGFHGLGTHKSLAHRIPSARRIRRQEKSGVVNGQFQIVIQFQGQTIATYPMTFGEVLAIMREVGPDA